MVECYQALMTVIVTQIVALLHHQVAVEAADTHNKQFQKLSLTSDHLGKDHIKSKKH